MGNTAYQPNYDQHPAICIQDPDARVFRGLEAMAAQLREQLVQTDAVVVLDCYPGVTEAEAAKLAELLQADLTVSMREIFKDKDALYEQMKYYLTEDRVFGRMYYGELIDFLDTEKLEAARRSVADSRGLRVVYGFGASLVWEKGLLCYFDVARWEIQLRFRKGMDNYKAENYSEDFLKKFKRGYFIEWRVADKHKCARFDRFDYYVDANVDGDFKMITGETFRGALRLNARRPFRGVPIFDPGIWGGKWMEEKLGLEPSSQNYAWSMNGIPEENSMLFDIQGVLVEVPTMNLTLYQPRSFLGDKVYARFGAEFPIRFNFLDTMQGQNLSLQVHPVTEYIKKNFGMAYTQDESYYILEAGEDATVFLGLKEGVDSEAMLQELRDAQDGKCSFDAEKYVNQFPARKHDHFLIPAGTCHCSGANTLVLEISATPYIFTFKLWDWGRVGLDGKPRPIHIEHGSRVIQWERTTEWVEENLINDFRAIREQEGYLEEHTGLHELEYIETRRHSIRDQAVLDCHESVNMLNLVEGRECVVESLDGSFEPYTVHYAETFIVPCSVGRYQIRTTGEPVKLVQAFVRV